MPESELIITLDSDDGIINTQDMELSKPLNSSKTKRTRLAFPFGACRVCSDSATGIHYGIATCEGCKGFFKRSILRKEKYRCYFDNTCIINVANRNRCKSCRFRRCIDEGMSVDGVKMGRIPKLVKERALKELKEQQMKEEKAATLTESNEVHARESSCSSLSDRSIENYDPNAMETDSMEFQVSPIQRHGDLTNTCINENSEKKLLINSPIYNDQTPILTNIHHSKINNSTKQLTEKRNKSITYRTFLSDDLIIDESDQSIEQSTGLLKDEIFKHVKTIANKLNNNQSNLIIELTEDEQTFIRYLRWSAYDIYLRHSKRLKQLISRMNEMIEKNIQEYPNDNATLAEFFHSIRLSCQIYTRSTVLHIQELPGMKNISLKNLQKMILHRTFDWFLIKYHKLFNDNGQCYYLAPNGFQYTRYWLNELHGIDLSNAMFNFCQRFRELNLSEKEFSLVLPFHTCYSDSTMDDQEIPEILRSCYFYALYDELCHNRGDIEGEIMCSKILEVLELLVPVVELYRKNSASRVLEA